VTYYIAWQDGNPMRPVTRAGTLRLFPSREDARAAAGVLGVPACVRWERVLEVCRLNELEVPCEAIQTALEMA